MSDLFSIFTHAASEARMASMRGTEPGQLPAVPPSAEVNELRADVERLYFITEALWRMLRDRYNMDENELLRQMTMIDMEDGKLDGRKAKAPPQPCPKCQRMLNRQRMKCIFCGELVAMNPFER